MATEGATYISDLTPTTPAAGADAGEGDDELRQLKSVLQATLPNLTGAMTCTQAELNVLDALASGKIILGNGSNQPAAVTPSGDVTINSSGTTAIGSGVIVNADVNASAAIDATKIHDGSVDNTEFGYLNGVTSGIQAQINFRPKCPTTWNASSTTTATEGQGYYNTSGANHTITLPSSPSQGDQVWFIAEDGDIIVNPGTDNLNCTTADVTLSGGGAGKPAAYVIYSGNATVGWVMFQ